MIPRHRRSVWYLTVQCTVDRLGKTDFSVSVGKMLIGSLWVSSWMLFSRVKAASSGGTTQQLSRLIWIASGLILAALWRSMKAWVSMSPRPSEEVNCWSKRTSAASQSCFPASGVIPADQDKMKRSAVLAPSSSSARNKCWLSSCHFEVLKAYQHLVHLSEMRE